MNEKTVLIVDEDEDRRRAFAQAFSSRGERCLDVGDGFAAMAAFGRADFSFVVAAEGRRRLSLRGLCQLARKRHPDIMIFILPRPGTTAEDLQTALEIPVEVLPIDQRVERTVTRILTQVLASRDSESTIPGVNVDLSSSTERSSVLPPPEVAGAVPGPAFDEPGRITDVFTMAPTPTVAVTAPPPFDLSLLPLTPTAGMAAASSSVTREEAPAAPHTASSGDRSEPTFVDQQRAPSTASAGSNPSAPAAVVVDGHFDEVPGGAGAALLMSLLAQEMTGRLTVSSAEAQGTLYLHGGEPVWADDAAGDAGLYRKLVQKSFLRPDQPVDAVPEGALLGSLLSSGLLTSDKLHAFMREVVRDHVIAVATQQTGEYRFEEDRAFLDTAPLLKVHPFGLILDSRRRQLAPPALLMLQSEIEAQFAIPGPGLGGASEKIRPFLRGARAADVIDGQKTVRDILQETGLDPFMGTLVVVVMRDARLIALETQPRVQNVSLADTVQRARQQEFAIAVDEAPAAPSSQEEAQAREDIWALYLRLKPLTQPRLVLGVSVDATEDEIDDAFRARLAELDPGRIPEGSAQHTLRQRVEELRRKVESAWQTLKLQSDGGGGSANNPF